MNASVLSRISPRRRSPVSSPGFETSMNKIIDTHYDTGHNEQFIARQISKELYTRRSSDGGQNLGARRRVPALLPSRHSSVTPRNVSHEALGTILDEHLDKWQVPEGFSMASTTRPPQAQRSVSPDTQIMQMRHSQAQSPRHNLHEQDVTLVQQSSLRQSISNQPFQSLASARESMRFDKPMPSEPSIAVVERPQLVSSSQSYNINLDANHGNVTPASKRTELGDMMHTPRSADQTQTVSPKAPEPTQRSTSLSQTSGGLQSPPLTTHPTPIAASGYKSATKIPPPPKNPLHPGSHGVPPVSPSVATLSTTLKRPLTSLSTNTPFQSDTFKPSTSPEGPRRLYGAPDAFGGAFKPTATGLLKGLPAPPQPPNWDDAQRIFDSPRITPAKFGYGPNASNGRISPQPVRNGATAKYGNAVGYSAGPSAFTSPVKDHLPFPESNISVHVKYTSDEFRSREPMVPSVTHHPPPNGSEPFTAALHRGKPIFTVSGDSITAADSSSPARRRWVAERLAALEKRRTLHHSRMLANSSELHIALRPAGPADEQTSMSVPLNPIDPAYASGHSLRTPAANDSFEQQAPLVTVRPHASPLRSILRSQDATFDSRLFDGDFGPVSPRSPQSARSPRNEPPSVLEQEMALDKQRPRVMEMDVPQIQLDYPDDARPVVPANQQRFERPKTFEWLKHPGCPIVLSLLSLRGIEYGINEHDDEVVESFMRPAFLNAINWMRKGVYLVKYGREGEPSERFFFIKMLTDSYTGKLFPTLCYASNEKSSSWKSLEPLVELVGVQRGVASPGFQAHKVPHGGDDWIRGMRIGNKRRLVGTKGCFTLTFRTRSQRNGEAVYRGVDLMTMREDIFHAWVPAFETIRSIMYDKNVLLPSHTVRPNFMTGMSPRPIQPPRQLAIKHPPGVAGLSEPIGQPPPPSVHIKQPPPGFATNAGPGLGGPPGKRVKALLIGISYDRETSVAPLRKAPLAASNMGNFLMRRASQAYDIRVLQDTGDVNVQSDVFPSKQNIIDAIQWLVSEPNSNLFLLYVGHGRSVLNRATDAIVPADFQSAGVIEEFAFQRLIKENVKPNTSLTCLWDVSGGSGPMLEYPENTIVEASGKVMILPRECDNAPQGSRIVVISGVAGEVVSPEALGSHVAAFTAVLSGATKLSYSALLHGMHAHLTRDGKPAHKLQLTSNQPTREPNVFEL
ncbi:Metacaspase-1 [Diplonema papillatum]|nr:Metacaspase-1 [Diplonema papillatum]